MLSNSSQPYLKDGLPWQEEKFTPDHKLNCRQVDKIFSTIHKKNGLIYKTNKLKKN